MNTNETSRLAALGGGFDRLKFRVEAIDRRQTEHTSALGQLSARVEEQGRRLGMVEIKLLIYALAGGAGGAVLGTAGAAAAKAHFGIGF